MRDQNRHEQENVRIKEGVRHKITMNLFASRYIVVSLLMIAVSPRILALSRLELDKASEPTPYTISKVSDHIPLLDKNNLSYSDISAQWQGATEEDFEDAARRLLAEYYMVRNTSSPGYARLIKSLCNTAKHNEGKVRTIIFARWLEAHDVYRRVEEVLIKTNLLGPIKNTLAESYADWAFYWYGGSSRDHEHIVRSAKRIATLVPSDSVIALATEQKDLERAIRSVDPEFAQRPGRERLRVFRYLALINPCVYHAFAGPQQDVQSGELSMYLSGGKKLILKDDPRNYNNAGVVINDNTYVVGHSIVQNRYIWIPPLPYIDACRMRTPLTEKLASNLSLIEALNVLPLNLDEILKICPAKANERLMASRGRHLTPLNVFKNADDLRTLLRHGADVNAISYELQRTPLHDVANTDALKVLLAAGADIDAVDRHGRTPVVTLLADFDRYAYSPCFYGEYKSQVGVSVSPEEKIAMLDLFVKAGARLDKGLLHHVKEVEVAKRLLGYDYLFLNSLDNNNKTPLQIAIDNNRDDIADILRKAGAVDGICIPPFKSDVTVTQGSLEDYKRQAKEYFEKRYPNIVTDKIGYTVFINTIGESFKKGQCLETEKAKIEKDCFNCLIVRFIRYSQLAAALDSAQVPDEFKSSQKVFFAKQLIEKADANIIDADAQIAVIRNISSDSYFISHKHEEGCTVDRVISSYYHNFKNLSAAAKHKIREHIYRINIHCMRIDKRDETSEDSANVYYLFDNEGAYKTPGVDVIIAIPKPSFLDKIANQ